jgi:hypothetical protein
MDERGDSARSVQGPRSGRWRANLTDAQSDLNRGQNGADRNVVPNASDGYFVRLDAAPSSRHVPVERMHAPYERPQSPEPPRKRRRRSNFRVRPMTVLLLAILGALLWLQTQPGGVSGQVNDWIDRIRGNVETASANPDLRRASEYFNREYARTGAYPALTEEQLREDPSTGFGIGVEVQFCNQQALVIQSLSGAGSVSRLLLSGTSRGDVAGRVNCPTDLTNPDPWKL